MAELAFVITAIISGLLGYFIGDIKDQLKSLQEAVKSHVVKERTNSVPKSVIVEPLTPEQEAQRDFAERVKRLNQ